MFCDDEPFVSGDGSCPQTKFSYNTEKGECEAFLYSGKGGNSNRYEREGGNDGGGSEKGEIRGMKN